MAESQIDGIALAQVNSKSLGFHTRSNFTGELAQDRRHTVAWIPKRRLGWPVQAWTDTLDKMSQGFTDGEAWLQNGTPLPWDTSISVSSPVDPVPWPIGPGTSTFEPNRGTKPPPPRMLCQFAERALSFLRNIGLSVIVPGAAGFIDHVRIKDGGLQVDPRCPASGLLHEAGHLAVVPKRCWHWMSGNLYAGFNRMLKDPEFLAQEPDSLSTVQ